MPKEKEKNKLDENKEKEIEIREIIVEKRNDFNTIEVVAIVFISILFGVVVGSIITYGNKSVSDENVPKELEEFVSTYNNIVDNYYDEVSKKDLVNAAIEGMVDSLDDPYSVYMNSNESEMFNEIVDGSYVGIGATVGTLNNNNYIISMFDKSPAEKAGLKIGDIFTKVGDKDVSSMSLEELTNLIKGKAGSKVKITVLRDGKTLEKVVTRNAIEIPSVTNKIIEKDNKKIGYISISTFAANTYKQFKKNLNEVESKKIDSLIIDVRSNPGGHLNQVTEILEMFIEKDQVLYQVELKGKKNKKYDNTTTKRSYNVAVIINNSSASASEILAAAFKESYDNSFIVGTKSYGKGTVQQAYSLKSGSSLKYTTEKWLTPKGNWINDTEGIVPDIEVSLDSKYYETYESKDDTQLQKALEYIKEK